MTNFGPKNIDKCRNGGPSFRKKFLDIPYCTAFQKPTLDEGKRECSCAVGFTQVPDYVGKVFYCDLKAK
jgi:hypothetical protein